MKQQGLLTVKKEVGDQYQHVLMKILKQQRPSLKAKKIFREPIIPNEKACSQQRISKKHDIKSGLKYYKRIKTSRKNEKVRQNRQKRCPELLRRFDDENVKDIIFTDEKDFTLEVAKNVKNDVVYGKKGKKKSITPNRLYFQKSRFSTKVMVIGGVSWHGETNLYFVYEVDGSPKVNAEVYLNILQDGLLNDCQSLTPNYVFMQDGASSHTSIWHKTF